jgi:uncharacterized protein YabN with tetrapyrrole methylase and pyrophosphatase domain
MRKRKIKEFEVVRSWAKDRGLYMGGDVKTQTLKLTEEVGELSRAVLKMKPDEFQDAIGDCMVVLINLAHLGHTSAEECLEKATSEILSRKGEIINGTFVKDE